MKSEVQVAQLTEERNKLRKSCNNTKLLLREQVLELGAVLVCLGAVLVCLGAVLVCLGPTVMIRVPSRCAHCAGSGIGKNVQGEAAERTG